MRIKLLLRTDGAAQSIPINYNYPLAAKIYHILSDSSPEYSAFLHDNGYLGADGKLRKLFTFSRLTIKPRPKLGRNSLVVERRHSIELVVSSPMQDDFIQHFVVGLFQQQKFELASNGVQGRLHVERVEVCEQPVFSGETRFRALSPIVLSTPVERHGRLIAHYLRPLEEEVAETMRKSLLKKYQTITGRPPQDDHLSFHVDEEYIKRRGGAEKTMTLVRLREGRPDQTNVKGFLAPFTLSGSVELMRTAWHAGIGDKCSMGFGCVDVQELGRLSKNKGSSCGKGRVESD